MQNQLKIALIQSDLVWENPKQNRENFSNKINTISEDVDVIVLPEMFTSAFTMHASKVAETMTGDTVLWMQKLASKTSAAIVGSLIILEENKHYNRLLFVCFAQTEKVIIEYKGWKVCPLVCYDLRFPVWARNVENYDVLLYVANWPKPRISAWDALLKARAIENMSYVIGVNRVGVDGVNMEYSGHSAVYDVLGNIKTDFEPSKEQIEIVALEKRHVEAYRNKLKFLNDKDTFNLL